MGDLVQLRVAPHVQTHNPAGASCSKPPHAPGSPRRPCGPSCAHSVTPSAPRACMHPAWPFCCLPAPLRCVQTLHPIWHPPPPPYIETTLLVPCGDTLCTSQRALQCPSGAPSLPDTQAQLPLLSFPTHAHTRLVPHSVSSVVQLSLPISAGVAAQSPPRPSVPLGDRAGSGVVGTCRLSLGVWGHWDRRRCGVSIAMYLLRLSWRLVAVEGACPRCTNTG